MKTIALALSLAGLPGLALAQQVSERRPADARGTVDIECSGGTVKVTGWDRPEVEVTGTLRSGAEGVEVSREGRTTRVEVAARRHPHQAEADLEVKVPAGSRVSIESFGARIEVAGVGGEVRAESVNGDIVVSGSPRLVEVESVNGAVKVMGRGARVRAESVNGGVSISEPGEDVEASTVNGPLTVAGGRGLQRGRLESVNGSVRFEGGVAPRGSLDVETVAGSVELALAEGSGADVNVYTFTGQLSNELGPSPVRKDGDEPGQELAFTLGGGGARITVHTLSGRVSITRATSARN